MVIGITGGIGSGKSTVTQYLISKKYKVIDADKISHEVTRGQTDTVKELAKAFGICILKEDGTLNRKKLAEIAFADPKKKDLLQKIVTDRVVKQIKEDVKTSTEKIIFLDVPLLFETGLDSITDKIWLVSADENVRIKRVMERDGITEEQVKDRMNCQMPEKEKMKRAHVVIDNSGDRQFLYNEIEMELKKYA